MYAIYGNMDPINILQMVAYIPAPWILWVLANFGHHRNVATSENTTPDPTTELTQSLRSGEAKKWQPTINADLGKP